MPIDWPSYRDRFTTWCKDTLFTPDVIRATGILNRFCDLHLAGLYRRLELGRHLASPKTPAELAAALGFVESADVTLRDMLRRLARRTPHVKMSEDGGALRFAAGEAPGDVTQELEALRAEMGTLGESYLAALEFLDFGAERFVESLREDPDFMDKLLSGRDGTFAELWHRATNVDPLQDLHGEMGARVISDLLPAGGTLLEIGGGTGNGIRHLLHMMEREESLDRLGRYIFTDISMRFILTTRKEMNARFPGVTTDWKFFDLNKPFEEQKIAPESVDLVYAVNAAHVAKDMVGFLQGCRAALKPGGLVVFAERVRLELLEMAPRELTLNLSIYHRSAAEKAEYRPMHCYLAPENWTECFARAGFATTHILPDLDALAATFPDQYAAVVIAQKS